MTEQAVLFEEKVTEDGKLIGIARLNAEASLNALNLDMIELLELQLSSWEVDPQIAAVWLEGAGDKAFCAGGDVVALHRGSAAYGEQLPDNSCEHFFANEYRLDYHLHTYQKPLLVWGSGFVMGGGMGLLCGAAIRLVTETTRMAMPEITIGLFPDVGGSYFLNKAPGYSGLFLGITGAQFNATDAQYLKFADHFIPTSAKQALLATVCESDDFSVAGLNRIIAAFAQQFSSQQPAANVESHQQFIDDICGGDDLLATINRITAYNGDDVWLQKAAKTLSRGCPITPFLVQQQLAHAKGLSLADVFRMELTMAVNAAKLGHFKEGVRALLIDKDRKPQWTPATFAEVTEGDINPFFDMPFTVHPLLDL